MSLVEISDADGVRTITVNRPDAYNSLNRGLRLALIDAFTTAGEDAATGGPVRTVVLQAEGKAFCSGQDLKEQLADAREGTGSNKVVEEYNPMMAALLSIPVPVIAAVQGPAAGAGWGIAMACDFRVMSSAASFKGAFSGVGLASDCGLSRSLTDTVGQTRALELLLFDEKIPAEKAAALGIVTTVGEGRGRGQRPRRRGGGRPVAAVHHRRPRRGPVGVPGEAAPALHRRVGPVRSVCSRTARACRGPALGCSP